jgi:hypothetical protein
MKKTLIILNAVLGCLALVGGLVLVPKVQAAGPNASQTAQSVMVQTTTDSTAYQITETVTWANSHSCELTHYTNTWDGLAPTISCNGGGQGGCITAPPTPAAPAPNNGKINAVAGQDDCTFYFGGPLSSDTYTQDVTVNVGPPNPQGQRGNWKFTYTYNVAPTTLTVDPATCWTCSVDAGGAVDVNFTGFVSSESFLKNNNTNTQKYSFTLLDSALASRVLNVTAQLQKQNPDLTWSDVTGQTISYGPSLPITASVNNYNYYANAGTFGNSAVLSNLDAPTPGNNSGGRSINTILTTSPDNFAGNNNDLAAGNVHQADYSGSFPGVVASGSYRIVVSGTVKDNAGSGFEPFSVSSTVVNVNGCTSDALPQPECTATPAP